MLSAVLPVSPGDPSEVALPAELWAGSGKELASSSTYKSPTGSLDAGDSQVDNLKAEEVRSGLRASSQPGLFPGGPQMDSSFRRGVYS